MFTLHRMLCSKWEVIDYAMWVMFPGSMMMDNFMQKSPFFFCLFEIQDFCWFNLHWPHSHEEDPVFRLVWENASSSSILLRCFVCGKKPNSSLEGTFEDKSSCTRKQDWKNHHFSRVLDLYFCTQIWICQCFKHASFFFSFSVFFHIELKSTEINAENVIIYIIWDHFV